MGSCRRHLLPIVFPREFPAVTLPAIIGAVLTLSAIDQSRAERAASAWDQAGTAPDGSTEDITLFCRIDTLDEVDYFRHGGILHFVLRQLLEQAEPAGDAD